MEKQAFPGWGMTNDQQVFFAEGMTLRDWFGGMAMISIMPWKGKPETIAKVAYQIADAMLKERGE